jgi:4-hydroxybutyrate dehydrogenase / sulfolactaldehyde 3-reductase
MAQTTVGFIGLGTMGRPMALNIQKHGHALTVFDIAPAALGALTAGGARAADSPAAVARASEVVITMLPDAPDVERAALGPDGVIEGLRPGALYVDMSTIDPATTRRIGKAFAERGRAMIDCPVGRTQDHAVAGTLVLMAGGDAALIERVRPVLMCMGETLYHCGGLGAGEAMKLVNNCLAASILAANAEALVSGVKNGLTVELMQTVIASTLAHNAGLATALPKKALAGDFTPGFMVRLAHKDVRLALGMAAGEGVETPIGHAALATLAAACERGLAGDDVSSVLRLREEQAGIQVRLPG